MPPSTSDQASQSGTDAGGSTGQTLDQLRARFALERVQAVIGHIRQTPDTGSDPKGSNRDGPSGASNASGQDHGVDPQDYRRRVENLPALILTNGLGQTLAYLLADSHKPENGAARQVASDLAQYLMVERKIYSPEKHNEPERAVALLEAIVNGNRDELRRATDEALAFLVWWKKLVRAFIQKKPASDSGGRSSGVSTATG